MVGSKAIRYDHPLNNLYICDMKRLVEEWHKCHGSSTRTKTLGGSIVQYNPETKVMALFREVPVSKEIGTKEIRNEVSVALKSIFNPDGKYLMICEYKCARAKKRDYEILSIEYYTKTNDYPTDEQIKISGETIEKKIEEISNYY